MTRTFAFLLAFAATPTSAAELGDEYLRARCVTYQTFLQNPDLLRSDAVIYYDAFTRGAAATMAGWTALQARFNAICDAEPMLDVFTAMKKAAKMME